VRPPDVHGAAIPAGDFRARRRRRPSVRLPTATIPARAWLAALGAAAALASSLAIGAHALRPGAASRPASGPGTALLGTATCADWQDASVQRQLTIISSLGVAATQPDPENPGATLAQGAAYGLFERACSTRLSRSFLLYEIYNRAASFRSVPGLRASGSSAFARP
jgi:hypothetical protein